MKLFLIGLMGSGKSFLGKKIAQFVNLPFIDLDSEIEKHEGLPVAEIFLKKGEGYFRTIEASVLRKSESLNEFVMATGGGTPCFHENMDFINKTGVSIFLDTPITEITKRLNEQDKNARPLLQGVSDYEVEQLMGKMFRERITFYERANVRISGTVTAEEILKLLQFKK